MYQKVSCIRRLYRFLPVEKIGIYLTHQRHGAIYKPKNIFRSLFSVSFKGVTDHSRLLNLPCLVCDHKLFFGNNWILFIKSLPNFTIENMRIIFNIAEGRIVGTTQFWWLWMVYITRSTVHRYNCFESMNDFKPEPRNPIHFIARNVTYDGVRY